MGPLEEDTTETKPVGVPMPKYIRDTFIENSKMQSKPFPSDSMSTLRQILFVGTVCSAMFTNQVGSGNTLTMVSEIGASFGLANPGEMSWLIASYTLTIGTFILVGGRLGDELGHKHLFITGMVWYALWSLVAGLAVYSSHVLFVFARVFQGMGPALTLPNGLALLGTFYAPGDRKNMVFALFGMAAPFGAITGFICAGVFALAWWPWIYWSQAIALAFLSAFSLWSIPSVSSSDTDEKGKPRRTVRQFLTAIDALGGVLGVSALVLFNFAWNQAVVVGWQQAYVYVCLLLGVLFGVAFFLHEVHWATAPLIPFSAFNMDIAFVFVCTATGWACFGIWVFYLIQVAMQLDGNPAIQMAAWCVPIIPSGLVSTLAVGFFISKVPASWIMVIGQVAYLVGSILAALRTPGTVFWTYYFFSVLIITVGMDTSFPASAIIFSNAVAPEYQGMGASIVMTIVNYSISLGLGFAGTVETNINHGGLTPADKLQGFRGALWMGVGLAGLGFAASLVFLLRDVRRLGQRTTRDQSTGQSAKGSSRDSV